MNRLTLEKKVQLWLKDISGVGIDDALKSSGELLLELHAFLKDNTEDRKTIGPLIGQIRGMQNKLKNIESVNWVHILGGQIAIGHRPGAKLMADIRIQGGSHIFTLLSEREGAYEIEKQANQAGLNWFWFSMSSASTPDEGRIPELESLFDEISVALKKHASIYIHCSAGIHRTGMITYGFLRYIGLSAEDAKECLKKLRETTSDNVGDERLLWGERFEITKGI